MCNKPNKYPIFKPIFIRIWGKSAPSGNEPRIRAEPESPQRKKPMGCRELKSEPVSYFNDHAAPRLITADLQAETDPLASDGIIVVCCSVYS